MTQPTQIRSYTGNDAPLPPPGYLAATSRGVTRYIPRDDPQPRRQMPALVGDVLPPMLDTRPPVQTLQTVTSLSFLSSSRESKRLTMRFRLKNAVM